MTNQEDKLDSLTNMVTRIDANLENFLNRFEGHEKDDKERFNKFEGKISWLEKGFYGACGILVFIEIISKIMK